MLVETHDHWTAPTRRHATRVLICSDDGTPIVLALERKRGSQSHFRVFRAGDADFNEQLQASGVARSVIVNVLER